MNRWARRLWAVVKADIAWTIGAVMGGLAVGLFIVITIAGLNAAQILKGLMP